MISGNTYQRNFTFPVPDPPQPWPAEQKTQFALAQKALGFNCLNYGGTAEPSLYRHFLPDKAYLDANCPQGVRFELMFPSCWNGELDSPNHKDHVAFPDQVMSGNCPSGYDRRLISLFYETIWNTAAFIGQEGQFVLANGDPTGYGYHGDFIAAWNDDLLFQAANNSVCNNPGGSGVTSDCPLFDIQPSASMSACTFTALPTALAAEHVAGPRSGLPGNVEIQSGPAYATRATTVANYQLAAAASAGAASTSAVVPTLPYTSATTSSADAAFYQAATSTVAAGAAFYQASSSTPSPTSQAASSYAPVSSSPAPSTSSAPAPPVVDAQAMQPVPIATSYWTEAGNAYEMIVVAETVTVTQSAGARKRHLHRHLAKHGGRR
ncbi:MAG: hypothetical protein LQ347_001193 [Umbilicaria vellea]|nr:MAG: hypothetical protein LQ347_001193 [Umbilicaria vellea]